jgi:hypothetical protein
MSRKADATAELKTEAARVIAELKRTVAAAETHWFLALMQAIRDWPIPQEIIDDRTYRYLVGREAFDWLLLAERLCDEIEDLVPDEEREALLFHGSLPEEVDEHDVDRLLGAKHRAHLNFVYGVRVEEALQLAVGEEVHKERFGSRIWENGHGDDEVFQRLYDASRVQLLNEFRDAQAGKTAKNARGAGLRGASAERAENGHFGGVNDRSAGEDGISLADLTEFTYWLFRRRVNGAEPARVASDTRKGVAMLHRLESRRRSQTSVTQAF